MNQVCISFFASAMKYVPSRFPIPRLPECSITHTSSFSSKQISMKWLPVPSVPRWRWSFKPRRRSSLG